MTDLKTVAMRFYTEVFNEGNLSVLDEILAEDFVDHEELPGLPGDKAGVTKWMSMMREAFPDLSVELLAMVAEGSEVWAHAVLRGTHGGEFMDIPATGRSIEVPLIDRVRFHGDQVSEHWGVMDSMLMMQQLGTVPEE